jgi:hypothetical protein
VSGFLVVASVVFIAVALITDVLIKVIDLKDPELALLLALGVAAVLSSGTAALAWRLRRPATSERWIRLRISTIVTITAVAFSLAYWAFTGSQAKPEVMIPIGAGVCFVLSFPIVDGIGKILTAAGWPLRSTDFSETVQSWW